MGSELMQTEAIKLKKKRNRIPPKTKWLIVQELETKSYEQVSNEFQLPVKTIKTIARIHRLSDGNITLRTDYKALSYCNEDQIKYINNLVDQNCSLTLRKIQKLFQTKYNQSISLPTLAKFIDNFKYSIDFGVINDAFRGKPEILNSGIAHFLTHSITEDEVQNYAFIVNIVQINIYTRTKALFQSKNANREQSYVNSVSKKINVLIGMTNTNVKLLNIKIDNGFSADEIIDSLEECFQNNRYLYSEKYVFIFGPGIPWNKSDISKMYTVEYDKERQERKTIRSSSKVCVSFANTFEKIGLKAVDGYFNTIYFMDPLIKFMKKVIQNAIDETPKNVNDINNEIIHSLQNEAVKSTASYFENIKNFIETLVLGNELRKLESLHYTLEMPKQTEGLLYQSGAIGNFIKSTKNLAPDRTLQILDYSHLSYIEDDVDENETENSTNNEINKKQYKNSNVERLMSKYCKEAGRLSDESSELQELDISFGNESNNKPEKVLTAVSGSELQLECKQNKIKPLFKNVNSHPKPKLNESSNQSSKSTVKNLNSKEIRATVKSPNSTGFKSAVSNSKNERTLNQSPKSNLEFKKSEAATQNLKLNENFVTIKEKKHLKQKEVLIDTSTELSECVDETPIQRAFRFQEESEDHDDFQIEYDEMTDEEEGELLKELNKGYLESMKILALEEAENAKSQSLKNETNKDLNQEKLVSKPSATSNEAFHQQMDEINARLYPIHTISDSSSDKEHKMGFPTQPDIEIIEENSFYNFDQKFKPNQDKIATPLVVHDLESLTGLNTDHIRKQDQFDNDFNILMKEIPGTIEANKTNEDSDDHTSDSFISVPSDSGESHPFENSIEELFGLTNEKISKDEKNTIIIENDANSTPFDISPKNNKTNLKNAKNGKKITKGTKNSKILTQLETFKIGKINAKKNGNSTNLRTNEKVNPKDTNESEGTPTKKTRPPVDQSNYIRYSNETRNAHKHFKQMLKKSKKRSIKQKNVEKKAEENLASEIKAKKMAKQEYIQELKSVCLSLTDLNYQAYYNEFLDDIRTKEKSENYLLIPEFIEKNNKKIEQLMKTFIKGNIIQNEHTGNEIKKLLNENEMFEKQFNFSKQNFKDFKNPISLCKFLFLSFLFF